MCMIFGYLAGGWTNPFEKYANVKLDHFPKVWGENKTYLKPPPSDVYNFCMYFLMVKKI